jgi:hypothetical protein
VAAVEARLAPQFEAGELDEGDVVSEQLEAGLFTLQVGVGVGAARVALHDHRGVYTSGWTHFLPPLRLRMYARAHTHAHTRTRTRACACTDMPSAHPDTLQHTGACARMLAKHTNAPARLTPSHHPTPLHRARTHTHTHSQGCVVISAGLWASGDPGLRKRLLALLHQRGRSLDMIRCGGRGLGCGTPSLFSSVASVIT